MEGYAFLPYFILFFFLNNVFLPEGLLFTTLLTPVFLYWLYKGGELKSWFKWTVLFLIPVPFHLFGGIDPKTYLVSSALILAAWIFFFTALEGIRVTRPFHDDLFKKILIINALLVATAVLFLPFPALRQTFWYVVPISEGIAAFPRMELLAYEPSHYALLMAPVFIYFLLKVATRQSPHPLLVAAAVLIPLLLSLSFGVLGAMFLAFLLAFLISMTKLPAGTRRLFISGIATVAGAAILIAILWPSNPVYMRLENIFTGTDTSARGRLLTSFMFAKDLILQHNAWMGVGPGQVKLLAHDLIINFYGYTGEYAETVRIPNSMAEMLAVYGSYGFSLKLFLEIFFFFRMKIWQNLYTLTLFLFIFIYQFTGSFIVNAAELGAWAFVFASGFRTFHLKNLKNPEL